VTHSSRSRITTLFFSRFVFVFFLLFQVYFHQFPNGYHYLAFFCMYAWVDYTMLSFFLHNELPALRSQRVGWNRFRELYPRNSMLLQIFQRVPAVSLVVRRPITGASPPTTTPLSPS
jgi:hypothetical protein